MDIKEFEKKYCNKECECEKGLIETKDFIRCIDKMITEVKDVPNKQ